MAPTNTTVSSDKLADSLKSIDLNDSAAFTVIDSCVALQDMLDTISDIPKSPPSLYIDLEGVELSRHGTISILQIFILPRNHTYLVDVYLLKHRTFSTLSKDGKRSLKSILEAEEISKVFFDVRNDSDALYHHFQIFLRGVEDLQLMELATRIGRRRYVNGLARCIEYDARMLPKERQAWLDAKEKGKSMFAPERGGSYEVFNKRPLPDEISLYCVQDVQLLPRLWSNYTMKMTERWAEKVRVETVRRIAVAHLATYNPKGEEKKFAPAGW